MPLTPLFRRPPMPVLRLSGRAPDAPAPRRSATAATVTPRLRGCRRPHDEAAVAAVRALIEHSVLTYGEIAVRTGVGRASICRWARDQSWVRPAGAPRATDTVPRRRAGRKLKLRMLAERLLAVAERHIRALETSEHVTLNQLMEALQAVKMARLEAMGRRRRRRRDGETLTGEQWIARDVAIRTALTEMRRGGVDLDWAPDLAVDLVCAAHLPAVAEHPDLMPRGWEKRESEKKG
ncbi:MAG: hypothetical protein Q8M26_05805 [Pseudolabrys sp.]|nr:hypothetical protein [Pseudolabrys sp.]